MKGIIASDIDGTLMREDSPTLTAPLFDEIRRLQSEGWVFTTSSGRQYNSLQRLFEPIAEEITYICSNGAVVFDGRGRVLGKTVLPRAQAEELAHDILAIPDCEVLISGQDMNYVIPKRQFILDLMQNVKRNNVTVIDRPEDAPEDIIKVSAYVYAGAAAFPHELEEKWAKYNPAVAGACWVDFTLADKGTGLVQLCQTLGVDLKDTIAFGDNYNDVPILSLAGTSYIMSTAAPALLERFPNHCTNVLEVLRTL